MTREEFLENISKKVEALPEGTQVILYDERMNEAHADAEGTREGVYHSFEFSAIDLSTDGETIYEAACICFINDTDYDDDCKRID